ncbi:MAG: SCO family protein [Candidatus Acidiferrum sp.]
MQSYRLLSFVVLICGFFGVGCQSAQEKRYPIQAEVISSNPERQMITVKHGDIPGLMPAMTMSYMVADIKQIQGLGPGDRISADLVVSDSKGRLENIVLVSKGEGKPSPGTSQRLPEKGETVPDFAFLNQNGKPIHIKDYLGKTLLVTFIYTRCPLPDYCPRMNENFRQIQAILREQSGSLEKASFLSISFDPEHDTPAVLKHYASIYNHATPTGQLADWQFAVPSAKDLPEVAYFFGLVYQPGNAQIVHSLSTTLIGPTGKIENFYPDNDWIPADVAQAITRL